jgi:hypothetical protein
MTEMSTLAVLYDEFVAADGTFEGDGRLCYSYMNPGNDEVKSCSTWHEVRTGVENSYSRVASLLGNNKKKLIIWSTCSF